MANNELGKDSLHRRNSSTNFDIHEEQGRKTSLSQMEAFLAECDRDLAVTTYDPSALTTLTMSNNIAHTDTRSISGSNTPHTRGVSHTEDDLFQDPVRELLTKIKEKQVLKRPSQLTLHKTGENTLGIPQDIAVPTSSRVNSVPETPQMIAAASFDSPAAIEGTGSPNLPRDASPIDANEVDQLKQQLSAANRQIARMDQELSHSRVAEHTAEQVLAGLSEVNFPIADNISEQTISNLQGALNASTRADGRRASWMMHDDAVSDASDPTSLGGYNASQSIWGQQGRASGAHNMAPNDHHLQQPSNQWVQEPARFYNGRAATPSVNSGNPQHRAFSGPSIPVVSDNRYVPSFGHAPQTHVVRRANTQITRTINPVGFGPASQPSFAMGPPMQPVRPFLGQQNGGWNIPGRLSPQIPPYQNSSPYHGQVAYQPQPIGTPLSPMAAEFNINPASMTPWNAQPPASEVPTLISNMEPLNYRRMLDRTISCDWKYIVDKIVCNNDQQASIFLQQKLKVGTFEQKYDIIEAILAQGYPLMINRFGNFLVQRAFEHGTPDQINSIANAIRGNTLNLSKDAFGCHVVQKAFDCVPEEHKAVMVHELLRQIPETVIHRYACHVWQKLFELRWKGPPPQIMAYVNEALRGLWPDVALGETGSLVVQNVFENCLEEDKRPCINEVLGNIDLVAHGQFGNWCIQHICEHGLPADQSHAIDHILNFATEYSMDQFASKVVEKCLKIGGNDFLERYLGRVCEGRHDRPRIPLVDIASDQYGNYLIQWILTHASPQHRETVASHIRKHMVSLRGSKFGSRVGLLCSNPAFATRPGPAVGPAPANRFPQGRFALPYGR